MTGGGGNQIAAPGVCKGAGVPASNEREGAAMGRWTHTAGVALVLAGTAAMAGCGEPEEEETASPLMSMFGEPESPAEQRAKQLEQEEAVAACMKAEGWEYTPIDYTAQFNDTPQYEDPSTPGYGEQHGYGIVYGFVTYELPYLDQDGNYADDSPINRSFDDPNSDYVNALSPEEQEQYYVSLNGDWSKFQEPSIGDDGEEVYETPPLDEQGCYGKAQQQVYGEQPWNNQDFNDRQNELFEALENDPAIDEAEITWSDCMYELDAAYDFAGPNDTYTYVQNMLNEVRGLDPVQPMAEDGFSEAPAATIAVGKPGGSGEQRLPTEAELDDVEAAEVELWKADQECQDGSGLRELRRQREQELVDTLREEFPQYIGSTGGGVG